MGAKRVTEPARFNMQMDAAEYEEWKEEARGEGRTLTALVTRAVRQYLARKRARALDADLDTTDSGPRRRPANGAADERDARE